MEQTVPPHFFHVVSQNRPWVRYFARTFDTVVSFSTLGALCIFSCVLHPFSLLLYLLTPFLPLIFEAAFLSLSGTTPGKWLLGTRVVNRDGTFLSFSQALKRAFSVWFYGVGLGIPFVSACSQILSYRKLKRSGMTRWDQFGGFIVEHHPIPPVRLCAVILIFFLLSSKFISFTLSL